MWLTRQVSASSLHPKWIFKYSAVKSEQVMSLVYLHFTLILLLPLSFSLRSLSRSCARPLSNIYIIPFEAFLSPQHICRQMRRNNCYQTARPLNHTLSFPLSLTVIKKDWRRFRALPRCRRVFKYFTSQFWFYWSQKQTSNWNLAMPPVLNGAVPD